MFDSVLGKKNKTHIRNGKYLRICLYGNGYLSFCDPMQIKRKNVLNERAKFIHHNTNTKNKWH